MRLPDLPVERGELAATEWPSAKIFKEYARYEMLVLDKLQLAEPKTRLMAKTLKDLGATRKALVVLPARDEAVVRASANIPGVKMAYVNTINVLDILSYDKMIITQDAVKQVEEVYEG